MLDNVVSHVSVTIHNTKTHKDETIHIRVNSELYVLSFKDETVTVMALSITKITITVDDIIIELENGAIEFSLTKDLNRTVFTSIESCLNSLNENRNKKD